MGSSNMTEAERIAHNVEVARKNREAAERVARTMGAHRTVTDADRNAALDRLAEDRAATVTKARKIAPAPSTPLVAPSAPPPLPMPQKAKGKAKVGPAPTLGMRGSVPRPGEARTVVALAGDTVGGVRYHQADPLPIRQAVDKAKPDLDNGHSVGLDVRHEGCRERVLPEDRPAVVGATGRGKSVPIPEGTYQERRRFVVNAVMAGQVDMAVLEREDGRLVSFTPRKDLVQVGITGIVRPTAEWAGRAGNATKDRADRYVGIVQLPRLDSPDGTPLALEREFPSECDARAFVLAMVETQGASFGEIQARGSIDAETGEVKPLKSDNPLPLCAKDPRFVTEGSTAMVDRASVAMAAPIPPADKVDNRPVIWTNRMPRENGNLWQKAKNDDRGGRAYDKRG